MQIPVQVNDGPADVAVGGISGHRQDFLRAAQAPAGGTSGIGAGRIFWREIKAGILGRLPHPVIHPVLEPEEAVHRVGPRRDGHISADVLVATGAAHHLSGTRDNGVIQRAVRDGTARAEEHNRRRLNLQLRLENVVLHKAEIPGQAAKSHGPVSLKTSRVNVRGDDFGARQSRSQVARMASEHTGGIDDGRLTATTRQHLDNDALQVRITVLAVKLPPERGVGKQIAGETWKALVPSRGQRAGVSSHSLFLGGPCHDVPVPELVEESHQGFHGRFTLNGCRHIPQSSCWKC